MKTVARPYRPAYRPWAKLWANEWLDSTVRWTLTEAERSRFIDILALAARSRTPGIIMAGIDADAGNIGRPATWFAGSFGCEVSDVEPTLEKLASQGRIALDRDAQNRLIVSVTNWEKYQSEYLRQRKYNKQDGAKATTSLTNKSAKKVPTEGEVDVDVDGEAEVERKNRATATAARPDLRFDPKAVKDSIEARRELYREPETAGQRRLRRNKEAADSVV